MKMRSVLIAARTRADLAASSRSVHATRRIPELSSSRPSSTAALTSLALLRRTCTHTTHAETALGEASARSARYPPALNVALADVIDEVCMQ
jgi:hypothetical protein